MSTTAILPARPLSADRAALPGRVAILTASFGGGHLCPALELDRRLTARGVRVEVIDLVTLLPMRSGAAIRATFRGLVTRAPAVWDRIYRATDRADPAGPIGATPAGRSPSAGAIVALLSGPVADILGRIDPDVVVSTYPLGARVTVGAAGRGSAPVPAISYVTDPGVHGLWVAAGTARYLAPWHSAATALRRRGATHVVEVAPLVAPAFTEPVRPDGRSAVRDRFGLPPGSLALVLSGSWGVGDMAGTARDIAAVPGVTPVVVCGRNDRLRRQLDRAPGVVALGWVEDMARLMGVCDVAVLNSGGASLAEAQAVGLPVIHYRALPGQGVANAAAEESPWSPWARTADELVAAIRAAPGRHGTASVRRSEAATVVDVLTRMAGRTTGGRHRPGCGRTPR